MRAPDSHATLWSHFRRRLEGRTTVYGALFGVALGIAVAAGRHDPLAGLAVAGALVAIVVVAQWSRARAEAADDFFEEFAPTVGLQYVVSGSLPPLTPLLSAGNARVCKHTMEGPLFGTLGGPTCTLTHYEFHVEPGDRSHSRAVHYPFTVCALELPEALPVFHGVYLRRRSRVPFLWDDWLARAHADEVDLESADFEQLYELRAAPDQDRSVLRQLLSPSLVVWLSEHPLRPGFECKAGMLVVFVPEERGTADELTLLHEAAREIARRVSATVAAARSVTPAG